MKLSLVVPVYFEEDCVQEYINQTTRVLQEANIDYELIFIDDGSADSTIAIIEENIEHNHFIKLIALAYNHGKQSAVTAGINFAAGNYILYMDPDLQDPPEMIPIFLAEIISRKVDLVWGVRKHKADTILNKLMSKMFWGVLQKMTQLDIPVNLAVMRIFSRRFADQFNKYQEQNRFIEGIFMKIGFPMSQIEIENRERYAGKSKFNFEKKMKLAFNAIYDFSDIPLKMSVSIGLFFVLAGVSSLFIIFILKLAFLDFQAGWPSLFAIITFYFGIVIFLIGIVAIYLGRVYKETKGRPLYSIKRMTNVEK